ncbi:MAG: replicative DNA helicase [Alistipes sp.]|nr:replicative DNA helicase [Alistipes sp.]MBO7265673.1 replicative DNA helicase [Alistipes sp.]
MAKQYNKTSKNNKEAYIELAEVDGIAPPQSIELEQAVLGALMLEKDAIIDVQEYLSVDTFYTEEHRIIFKAIQDLSFEMKAIDLYTVTERLKAQKELTKVGGAAYLADLTQRVATAAHVEFHAKIIAQKYVQRELIRSATEIQRRSYDEEIDVTELIGFAEQEIFKVSEGNVKRSVLSASDILHKALKQIEAAAKTAGEYNGVRSGFTDIDSITLGWQPSDLIIIAARPSMGKTAFVLTMARNMAVEFKTPVAFFSLEMSSVQLMNRLIVAETQLSSKDLRTGNLTPAQWAHLEKQTIELGRSPLYIDDTPALSVYEFRSKARRLKTQHDIKLIIIDYLQLMTAATPETRGNREQEVSLISRTLKAIAKELDVPIIALSQLSRNVENRGGSKRPQLSDLRESGAIEQDADVVAFIHRPEYYGLTTNEQGLSTAGMAEIIIAKHRNGEVTDVPLRFIKEQAKFADADASITNDVLQQPMGESYETFSSSGNSFPPMSSAPEGMQSSGMASAGVPSEFDIAPF